MTDLTRRDILIGGAAMEAAAALPAKIIAAVAKTETSGSPSSNKGGHPMTAIMTKDGTQIYYKDWGKGTASGLQLWLGADAFEGQMFFLASRGYRYIAHDRRGHGRSSQPWNGNDMDTYADDLATLVKNLDLKNAIHVDHSTGGGEVARHEARGQGRADRRSTAADAVDGRQSRRLADRGFRRHPRQGPGRSLAVLEGSHPAVLRL